MFGHYNQIILNGPRNRLKRRLDISLSEKLSLDFYCILALLFVYYHTLLSWTWAFSGLMLVGGSNSAAASLRLVFVGHSTREWFLINILLIGLVNSTPRCFGPGKLVLWQSQHLWWSSQAISGYLRISQSVEAGQGLQIYMLSYKQAQTGNYLPTGIILGKQPAWRHRPGERSVKREFIYCCGPGYEQHHGPVGRVDPAGFEQPPRGPVLTHCTPNPNLCHNILNWRTTPSAMFAQLLRLCVHISNPSSLLPVCFLPLRLFGFFSSISL